MSDIRPDDDCGVLRCSVECPSIRLDQRGLRSLCIVSGHGGYMYPRHTVCIPAVRQLVALSKRRCDGCRHWHPDESCHLEDYGVHRSADDYCRNGWEEKT